MTPAILLGLTGTLGGALGLAVLATIAINTTKDKPTGTALPDVLTHGYTAGLLGAAASYLAALLTALMLVRPHPANEDTVAAQPTAPEGARRLQS